MLNVTIQDVNSIVVSVSPDRLGPLFDALAQHLLARGAKVDIVVAGGAALQALGLVSRTTKDVDILAIVGEDEHLETADPLPDHLRDAAERVGRDFGLASDWLNPGPTRLLDLGLPHGFWSRVATSTYGPALTVRFAGRLDLIHFKLYAMTDQGPGRHEADLRAMDPSRDELIAAARWALTHDVSESFRDQLIKALEHLAVTDVDLGP
jgi:hypothetical protein